MKAIFELFMLDWKRILKNPITLTIIIGLMIIPSLYAWFNILALWDPYGSTSSLPIGVYSADLGYELKDEQINIGDEVLTSLHENKDIAWQFSSSETEVDEAVNSGEYFAGIIVDENFTRDLVEYLDTDDNPKPQLRYVVNEKINAIAPKITDEGVSSIKEQITTEFVIAVSQTVSEYANELGINLQDNAGNYDDIKALITEAHDDLPAMADLVTAVNNLTVEFTSLDSQVQTLDNYDQLSIQISDFNLDIANFVASQEEFNQNIESDVKNIENNESISQYALQINTFNDQLIEEINTFNEGVNAEITSLETITENENYEEQVPEELKALNETLLNNLTEINEQINTHVANLNQVKTDVDTFEQSMLDNTNDLLALYNNEYKAMTESLQTLSTTLNTEFPSIDATIKSDIAEIQNLYPEVNSNLIEFNSNIQGIWPDYQGSLNSVYEKMQQDDIDLSEIGELLLMNPSRVSELLSEPIDVQTTVKYQMPNYGSQSAPFYTALCLWVGAVLLSSVLTTKYHLTGDKEYSIRQQHLGRMLTYVTIAIVQAIIVSAGNIYLLGAFTVNPGINILCSVFIAICFNIIVYTLASLFDNFGKAIAVVLLVLSVAGGGGNFPIELSSEFFQTINPLLPFTHAVNLLRETVGGIYVANFKEAVVIISVETILVLVVGTIFAPTMIKFTEKVMKRTDDSHIFH